MPHRVLRTELVDHLEESTRVTGLYHAARNAQRFKKMTGLTWRT